MMSTSSFPKEMHPWRQFAKEIPFVLGSISLLTMVIIVFHLSTRVPDSLLLYLLVVLIAACVCGLRAAFLASFVAFLTFDYLFVPPAYAFGATKLEDILGLIVFLATTLITSQITSSLRARIVQARRHAYEARTLYEFVRATNRESDFERQLTIFARTIVEVFSFEGVRDCMVLLPDASETLHPPISAHHLLRNLPLIFDEEIAVRWVMLHARGIDLHHNMRSSSGAMAQACRSNRKNSWKRPRRSLIRLVPLKTERKVYGVLRLLIEEKQHDTRREKRLGREPFSFAAQDVFFSTFLEQAITIIEQERLRAANIHLEVLQQTEELRAALFSSVSHDLRTPLATIKASVSELLQEEIRQNPESYNASTSLIEREVDRLDSFIENVLDMSRIEAGKLRLDTVWYPLDELVNDTVNQMRLHFGTRKIQIAVPDDLPPVKLDAVQIRQVVFNLLENALRYTPEGSPIELCIQQQEAHMQVSVADRGPGIPLSEQENIFAKFYRFVHDESVHQRFHGLGLGLTICREIVQAHGGRIWVKTREGGGALFCFTLPFEEIEEGDIDE